MLMMLILRNDGDQPLYQYLNSEGEDLDTHPANIRSGHLPDQRGELVPVLVDLLHGEGAEDGPEVALQCLQDGTLDLVLLLAQELLGGGVEQLGVLHDLDLGHPGDGEGNPLGRLHVLTDRIESHHLQR